MEWRVRPESLLAGRAENGRHKTIVADWTRLHLMIFLMNALGENRQPAFMVWPRRDGAVQMGAVLGEKQSRVVA